MGGVETGGGLVKDAFFFSLDSELEDFFKRVWLFSEDNLLDDFRKKRLLVTSEILLLEKLLSWRLDEELLFGRLDVELKLDLGGESRLGLDAGNSKEAVTVATCERRIEVWVWAA